MIVLFAYCILKPVSRALFLNPFDIDKLPYPVYAVLGLGDVRVRGPIEAYLPREVYSAYLAVSRQQHGQFSAALEFLDNALVRDPNRVLLPVLDEPDHPTETGRQLFGIESKTLETAVRELIRSGDLWLVACAWAAAGELRVRGLAAEIRQATENTGAEMAEVAESTTALLAA